MKYIIYSSFMPINLKFLKLNYLSSIKIYNQLVECHQLFKQIKTQFIKKNYIVVSDSFLTW